MCCINTQVLIKHGIILLQILILYTSTITCCTTIIGGRHTTTDGSTFVTHNNDCTDCDIRLNIVPSSRLNSNTLDVHTCKFSFPRYLNDDRGGTYTYNHSKLEGLHDDFLVKTQFIKQLQHEQQQHTYSYIDGTYGIANQHQLAIGESTCSAKLIAYGYPIGDALFDISALSRIALSQCKTARCAIKRMGYLAEKYGYYGANDPRMYILYIVKYFCIHSLLWHVIHWHGVAVQFCQNLFY